MREEKHEKMHDQDKDRSCIYGVHASPLHDQRKSLEITGFSAKNGGSSEEKTHKFGSCNIAQFVAAPKAASLIGCAPSTITRQCKAGKFPGAEKVTVDGVEVWQIPIESLPVHAQSMLRAELAASFRERLAAEGLPIPAPDTPKLTPAEYSIIWEGYERSGATQKRRAEAAHKALLAFHRLCADGFRTGDAEKQVASLYGVSKSTLWRYRQATDGHPEMHWLPLLSPHYKGGRPPVEFTEAAYEHILGQSLNSSGTPLSVIIGDARRQAKEKGWAIPSDDTVRYRLEKEPAWLATVGRIGKKALERSYPAVQRDYTSLKLHELWESDGRQADLFCRWPDGTIDRPFIIIWREVRTRLVLAVKGFLHPHAAGVLATLGQALERAGTAPDYAKLDNGREYAAKSVTGGQKTRYRFHVVPGEPVGIMTMIGTKAEWSKPGRGQDKPVENFWEWLANHCDKVPEFEGAYCGKDVVSKPENFAKANAIPLAIFGAKLASAIDYYNRDHSHTGSGMGGRSPLEVYEELAKTTKRAPVDPAHIRLCKQGFALAKPSAKDATYTITIPGYGQCRYWSENIAGMSSAVLSRKHSVYYDLDNPNAPVSIYDGEQWLGDAPQLEALPFRGAGDAAAEHVKKKNAWMKPKIEAVKQAKAKANKDQLPALPTVTGLGELPPVIGAVTFSGKPKALPATGETAISTGALSDAGRAAVEEMKRQQEEKRRRANPHLYQHVGT